MSSDFNPFSYNSLLRSIRKKINSSKESEFNKSGSEKKSKIIEEIEYKDNLLGIKWLFTKPKNPEDDKYELSDYIGIFIFMIIIAICAAYG